MEVNVKTSKRRRRWLLVLAASLAMASGAVADTGTGTERLLALLHEFMAGASNNDPAMHERFWDDELVYTSSAGTRFGKPEILSGLRGPAGPGGIEYSAEEIDVRLHGEIAVITFRLVASGADDTRQEYFNTGVFRLHQDEWRAVTWQATRVAEAATE
jgi:hypothetical protein